jgi:hypothetical protein
MCVVCTWHRGHAVAACSGALQHVRDHALDCVGSVAHREGVSVVNRLVAFKTEPCGFVDLVLVCQYVLYMEL